MDEPTGFDPGPDGGSRSDTPDGEGDAGAHYRSPEKWAWLLASVHYARFTLPLYFSTSFAVELKLRFAIGGLLLTRTRITAIATRLADFLPAVTAHEFCYHRQNHDSDCQCLLKCFVHRD